jgi:DNA-binding CsgD family transcriptional regulator
MSRSTLHRIGGNRLSDASNLDVEFMTVRIDKKDLDRLVKVHKLFNSPLHGEAASARARAEAILAKYGKGIEDLASVLRGDAQAKEPQPDWSGFTFYDMNNPDHRAAYAEAERTDWTARARKEKPERDAVIKRYGSEEAVLAPCVREAKLREAVRQWSVFYDPPNQRWTKSIDGWTGLYSQIPTNVREALSAAYPLPVTIDEAWTEYSYWEKRDRDIGLILENTSDTQLDMPAHGRWEIVRDLLEAGLRVRTINDVLIRQRHFVGREYNMPNVEEAVLADLEVLAEMAKTPPESAVQTGHVHNGQRETATQRREEVIRLLSNLDTVALSDREIARRVGVSPQTVGNIRRRLMVKATAKVA